jgi:hypothetical protein
MVIAAQMATSPDYVLSLEGIAAMLATLGTQPRPHHP